MSAINEALKVVDVAYQSEEVPDWEMFAKIRGLLKGYDARWREAQRDIVLLETEAVRDAPLVNPDTGKASRTWTTTAVLDKITAGPIVYDHKTTSSDISDPAGQYWKELTIAAQPALYDLSMAHHGERPREIRWDVVHKIRIKPKQITKALQKQIVEEGVYCGQPVPEAIRKGNVEREGPVLFEMRVTSECLSEPDKYYARRSVPRTDKDLVEYAEELWQIGQGMRDDRRRGTAFKNSSACFNYNTPCEFLPLCCDEDMPDSDRWEKRTGGKSSGKDALSHNRISTWQTCRRKHFYRYELGIQRAGRARSVALTFGSLFGEALDVYWTACFKEKCDDECNEQSPRRGDSRQTELAL